MLTWDMMIRLENEYIQFFDVGEKGKRYDLHIPDLLNKMRGDCLLMYTVNVNKVVGKYKYVFM